MSTPKLVLASALSAALASAQSLSAAPSPTALMPLRECNAVHLGLRWNCRRRVLANSLDCWVAGLCEGTSNWWETQARNATENLWIAARVHLKASHNETTPGIAAWVLIVTARPETAPSHDGNSRHRTS